jgi:hypothetical protein
MLLHSELLSFSNAPLDFEKLASNFMLCVSFSNMLFWSIPVSNRHALKYKIVIHTISSTENTIVASVVGRVSEFSDTHWFWFSLFNFFFKQLYIKASYQYFFFEIFESVLTNLRTTDYQFGDSHKSVITFFLNKKIITKITKIYLFSLK